VGWYAAYRAVWRGVDWLFPPVCGGCGSPGARWCAECAAQTRRLTPPWCPRCGEPAPGAALCRRCQELPPAFEQLRSWALFEGPVRAALHRIKYRRDLPLADALAASLVELYRSTLQWHLDMVVPVPLSAQRRRARGYNQAALFAFPLALALGLSYRPAALERTKHTRSQVDLSWRERRRNVAGAFQANPAAVSGQHILLVDDVATTGATLNACAAALQAGGARSVYALTVARAVARFAKP